MHGLARIITAVVVPLVALAAPPGRADGDAASGGIEAAPPSPAPRPSAVSPPAEDAWGATALHAGVVALGAALGATAGFAIGAAVAGGAYPLVRREPPAAEGLAVGIGTPVALTVAGAGAGALLAPMAMGEAPSLAGGLGATGGAAVAGVAGAVPRALLTWEATKSMGAAFDQPSPEGCILSLVGVSAALSVMFGGFCAGASCGGAVGGAGGALFDTPVEETTPPPSPSPVAAVAY